MVKSLSGNNNDKDLPAQESPDSRQAEAGGAVPLEMKDVPWGSRADYAKTNGIGAYGEQSNKPSDYSAKAWEESNKPWNSSAGGRFAIRLFSRGVMGAAFFAAGGALSEKWLERPHNRYRDTDNFFAGGRLKQDNPLKIIAKTIDRFVGVPIEWSVRNVSEHVLSKTVAEAEALGRQAVTFRPTKKFSSKKFGRSLGHEVCSITFDFFCASVGDALGRDIAAFIDPNIRHSKDPKIRQAWLDENGHFKPTEAVNSLFKAITRYVTYNGGEDWAVAIPYAYYMKGQRVLIDKMFPGFKYDFDHSLNGGSFKIDNNGKITGSYAMAGALDLQGRFTAYNMGTLMFREAYDYVQNWKDGNPTPLYGAPDKEPTKGLFNKMADIGKWFVRDVIKGGIYMTPIVPSFWITRITQKRHKSLLINPQKGFISFETTEHGRIPYRPDQNQEAIGGTYMFSQYDPSKVSKYGVPYDRKNFVFDEITNSLGQKISLEHGERFNVYQKGAGVGPLDRTNRRIGRFIDKTRNLVEKPAIKFEQHYPRFTDNIKSVLGIKGESLKKLTKEYTNAVFSYTPYMYLKAEAANRWDNGEMDMSIERMIDGITHLKLGEFTAGIGETWRTFIGKDQTDPERENEARRRRLLDNTPPEDFDQAQHEYDREQALATWGQKVIISRKPNQDKQEPVNSDVAGRVGFSQRVRTAEAEPSRSHAEQEAMRKALDELNPPTNSIH